MLHNMRQPQHKILEKDDKVTAGIFMLYYFRTRLNEVCISSFIFCKVCKDIYLQGYLVRTNKLVTARQNHHYCALIQKFSWFCFVQCTLTKVQCTLNKYLVRFRSMQKLVPTKPSQQCALNDNLVHSNKNVSAH